MTADPFVHPTAVVEPGAALGRGVAVWHHAHVRAGASIGDNTIIGKNAFVDSGVTVGANCKIQNNASIYRDARLGIGVFVGPGVILTNDRSPRAVNPDRSLKTADDWKPGWIVVEDGASIGAGSIILPDVTVGTWAVIGAGAVVRQDVAPHAIVVGVPGRVIGHACYCGDSQTGPCPTCGWHPESR